MTAPIRVQYQITFISLVLFAGKIWAWYLTRSVAILTDALESIVNIIAGFVGLYSILLAARPRDTNHPYGHGKAEFISAGIEGTLITLAGLFIMYEAVIHLLVPRPVQQLGAGVIITAITGVLNFLMGTYAVSVARKHRSVTVEAAGKHLKTDAWSTFAIVAGLSLLLLTGWHWLDGLVALVCAVFVLITGYKVIRKSLAGIMDEADEALVRDVINFLQQQRRPQWVDLHNLRVIQYGASLHIDAHLTVPWYYLVKEAETEIHALEDLIRSHFANKVEVFIHLDACMPYQCHLCAVTPCPERQEPFRAQVIWNEENVWADSKHGQP